MIVKGRRMRLANTTEHLNPSDFSLNEHVSEDGVMLRMDDGSIPEFWMEVHISLHELETMANKVRQRAFEEVEGR